MELLHVWEALLFFAFGIKTEKRSLPTPVTMQAMIDPFVFNCFIRKLDFHAWNCHFRNTPPPPRPTRKENPDSGNYSR